MLCFENIRYSSGSPCRTSQWQFAARYFHLRSLLQQPKVAVRNWRVWLKSLAHEASTTSSKPQCWKWSLQFLWCQARPISFKLCLELGFFGFDRPQSKGKGEGEGKKQGSGLFGRWCFQACFWGQRFNWFHLSATELQSSSQSPSSQFQSLNTLNCLRFGVFIYFPQFEPPYRLSLRPSTVRHKAAEKDLARIAALRSRRTLVSDTVQGLACHCDTFSNRFRSYEQWAVVFFLLVLAVGCQGVKSLWGCDCLWHVYCFCWEDTWKCRFGAGYLQSQWCSSMIQFQSIHFLHPAFCGRNSSRFRSFIPHDWGISS